MNQLMHFIKNEDGASMAEYALLVGLVAIGVIAAVTAFRNNIRTTFTRIGAALQNAQ